MSDFTNIERMLKKYNQEHILKFYDDIEDKEKASFINQIQTMNFEKMNSLYKNSMIDEKIRLNEISPIKYISKEELTQEEKEKYSKAGMDAISKNQLAVVTLAGRTREQTSE